jgi:DNA recombination protein RmuC
MSDAVAAGLAAVLGGGVVLVLWLQDRARTGREAARLLAERDAAVRALDAERRAFAESHAGLRDTFKALAHDALRDNRHDFLHNADAVLVPVRQALDRVQATLTDVDKAREGSMREVATQLTSLSAAQEHLREAAEGLASSLKSPNVRGRWGELQLRRIVELAGMLGQCDFVEKESAATEDGGRQTPDLVVKLPGETSIVVDAKVPIDAFLLSTSAKTDAERRVHLSANARQVREHIRALGAKEYWRQFQPAPEMVVMFLPLEPLLAAAFEEDGALLEYAAGLRIVPATPMTLLAILKAVGFGWRQQEVAANAEEIRAIGRELYERLSTMVEHLEGVGRNIKQAADSYDRFVASLEHRVLPGARKFKELGLSSPKSLDVVEPLALTVRPVTRPEPAADTPTTPAGDAPAEPEIRLLKTKLL